MAKSIRVSGCSTLSGSRRTGCYGSTYRRGAKSGMVSPVEGGTEKFCVVPENSLWKPSFSPCSWPFINPVLDLDRDRLPAPKQTSALAVSWRVLLATPRAGSCKQLFVFSEPRTPKFFASRSFRGSVREGGRLGEATLPAPLTGTSGFPVQNSITQNAFRYNRCFTLVPVAGRHRITSDIKWMAWIAFLCRSNTNQVNGGEELQDMRTPILQGSNCSPSCDYQFRLPCSLEDVAIILRPNRVRIRVQLFWIR
jgi:hypothetical protein